jgi:hypothetical protein
MTEATGDKAVVAEWLERSAEDLRVAELLLPHGLDLRGHQPARDCADSGAVASHVTAVVRSGGHANFAARADAARVVPRG